MRIVKWMLIWGLAVLAAPVQAEEAQPAERQKPERAVVIEEIVVTAQKREETLQDTPISMAAFSPEDLEQKGVDDLSDITAAVANVDITPFPNSRSSLVIFMRGIGNNDVQTSQDPAVGVYIDGVYLGRAVGLTTDVADLERIEVLRGPQGTLYGRNTTAGAVNLITAKPTGEAGGYLLTGFGNRGYQKQLIQLDSPAWGDVSAKLTLSGSQRDGFVKNLGPGPDFGEEDKEANRLALHWDASDALKLDYAYDESSTVGPQHYYQVLRLTDMADAASALQMTLENEIANLQQGGMPVPQALADQLVAITAVNTLYIPTYSEQASEDRRDSGRWFTPVRDSDTQVSGHSLIASLDLGGHTLKSITGQRDLSEEVFMDYGAGQDWFDVQIDIEQDQLSQEFQLVGDFENLKYVAGLYYFEENGFEHEIDKQAGEVVEDRSIWTDNKATAIYGQATWTPSAMPSLDLTLGGRYTRDERKARKHSINFENSPNNTQEGDGEWSNFTPSLTASYTWSDTHSTYVKAVTGYKSGGFNIRSTEEGFLPPFDEEQMISYEAGWKAKLLDNRLRLNTAIYHAEYDDMQIQQILDNSKIFLTDVFNAGAAEVTGFEIDLLMIPTAGLTINLGYGYTDAEFTEVIDNNPNSNTHKQDISDIYTMPYAPEKTYTLGAQYEFSRFDFGGVLIASADYNYRDERFGTASNPDMEGFRLDDYGLLNARLSLSEIPVGKNMELSVAAWGKNLRDEEYLVHKISMAFFHSGYFGEPRTYGLDLKLSF